MSKVYITGHRNPDLDSLCAALSYARLKNLTDSENEYIPVHCSPVSDSVRKQMEVMELEIPEYKKDVRPKVRDVMLTEGDPLQEDAPIFDLIKTYSTDRPSVVQINSGDKFKGLLSVDDITGWFLRDNGEAEPVYRFTVDNLLQVMQGTLVHKGESDEVEGVLVAGAAGLDSFRDFLDANDQCIVVMGARKEHIEYAVEKQVPAIIIAVGGDPDAVDYSGYRGTVIKTPVGTSEALRRARLAESVGSMMIHETGTIDADDLFMDAREFFLKSRVRGLAVMDDGKYAGYITRRCLLEVPKHKVIMVDHNEPGQSIEGVESADVVEIIDHHRLDSVSTTTPIFIDAEPLGSTCTIVYQQYIRHGIMPDQYMARVMLTGIIADTLILRSPTTTVSDISTVEMLSRLAKVPSIEAFGEKLFSITDNLATQDPEDSILSDFKKYESGGVHMGIGQCEVTTLGNVGDYSDKYLEALETIRGRFGLDWTLLIITDVLREKSVLLTSDFKANRDLPYKSLGDRIYDMPGVMSRKKQLLPTLIAITAR